MANYRGRNGRLRFFHSEELCAMSWIADKHMIMAKFSPIRYKMANSVQRAMRGEHKLTDNRKGK